MGFDIRGGMIGELWAVLMGITVESRFPPPGSRKTDDITIAALIRHIHHHNDAVGRSLFVPAMKCNDFVFVIKMIEMEILSA